ncbi:MAG TPA: NAD(P)/FAD-dependent oxidoreductase [Cyclobacteriaceae bacterium]|nr:FAD-dependent oxidoreductase [Cytophagales bacterium]HRE67653.1 NAD(P)/FAD-dependent oxidoreductase [Cyclobacteriaceae bacterium]HRF33806.1 NAD(P)/FAD-dependent oxidoreductase [Cyclobacteriaceae bacterium]
MKRRKAIKSIGLGLTAGLWLPSALSSCKKDDPGPEVPFEGTVAIIGGGAAGLYAADILGSKGIKVIILEAGNQLGGRVRSLRNQHDIPVESSADFPVELGAEVVYGTDSSWGNIIKNYTLTRIELNTQATERFILENQAKTATDWGSDSDLQAVKNFIDGLPSYSGGDVSMNQAAGVSPRAQALLNSMAGNRFGSNSDRVGAKGVAEALSLIEHDNTPYVIKTNPLQDIITSRFSGVINKVQLNTAIKSINYSGEKIILTDQNNSQIEVEKVVVTVPLGVLKTGGITFSPGLPAAKVTAMNKIGFDHSLRIIIDFKKNFWGDNTGYLWGGTEGPAYFNTGVARSEFYRTLSVTVHGPKAKELSDLGDGMIDAVLAELDAIYNGEASLFIRKVLVLDSEGNLVEGDRVWFKADWGKDEFFKGGISYLPPGSSVQDRVDFSAPINSKVFFAGEATDNMGDAGTVNGALNSAERVAEEVVLSIINA